MSSASWSSSVHRIDHRRLRSLYRHHLALQSVPESGAAILLGAAEEVASGRASAEDADQVYVVYLDSVMARAKAQWVSSRKVQVSKLRQIMLLAEEQPAQAHKLAS
jgi:hypothetical protein